MPELVPFPVDRADITGYYEALAAALDGSGPALAPYEAGTPEPEFDAAALAAAPDDLALVVATSGSTGTPKRAMLTRGALVASATATHDRIGAGTWLLPLPPHHIAGTQVIVRSIVSGTTPTVLDDWSLEGFTKATGLVARNAPPFSPIHTSLVPTQLRDLLDGDDETHTRALAAARRYRSILVGGSATPRALLERAREAGLSVVTTYGSSETSGGCVYDGTPLDGVGVRVIEPDDDGVGRIALTGPMLAAGYLGDPERTAVTFVDEAGAHHFLTDDLGSFDGTLAITGRIDDVITTGGYKVSPRVVEEAVQRVPGVRDAVVVARPHERWGQTVAVAIVTDAAVDATEELSERLLIECRRLLPPYAVPRLVRYEEALPLTGVGKPDRAFVARHDQWQNLR